MRLIKHISYANVTSTLALFLALGGVSYAATALPHNSVGSTQIKANAVTTGKVKNGSLLAKDFKSGQIASGAGLGSYLKSSTAASDYLSQASAEAKFASGLTALQSGTAASLAPGSCAAFFDYGVGGASADGDVVAGWITDSAGADIPSLDNQALFLPGTVGPTSQGGTIGYSLVCNTSTSAMAIPQDWTAHEDVYTP